MDDDAGPACRGKTCDAAANPDDAGNDSGRGGGNTNGSDGGTNSGTTGKPVQEEELEARLQVNGADGPCGSCAVLVAQASGGEAPYTYDWSDASLQGAGPHTVCPEEPTEYTVKVTDDSAIESGEFQRDAMVVEASGEVACVDDEEAWGGCFPPITSEDEAPHQTECAWNELDPAYAALLGVEETRVASAFSSPTLVGSEEGLIPGKTYEISYDQILLQLNLGNPVTVQIWGSEEPCGQDQLLGTLTLDGRWHQSQCFVAEEAWPYTRIDIDAGDVLFYLDFVPAASTVCRGCSDD